MTSPSSRAEPGSRAQTACPGDFLLQHVTTLGDVLVSNSWMPRALTEGEATLRSEPWSQSAQEQTRDDSALVSPFHNCVELGTNCRESCSKGHTSSMPTEHIRPQPHTTVRPANGKVKKKNLNRKSSGWFVLTYINRKSTRGCAGT